MKYMNYLKNFDHIKLDTLFSTLSNIFIDSVSLIGFRLN